MARRNIYEILNSVKFDIGREYNRIYSLYFNERAIGILPSYFTIDNFVENAFRSLNKNLIKDTTSLDDFNETYGYEFCEEWEDGDIDLFVWFCEYIINFTIEGQRTFDRLRKNNSVRFSEENQFELVIEYIRRSMEKLQYKEYIKDGIHYFAEANQEVIAVAEIVSDKVVASVFEYNHFKLKGQLDEKLRILKALADDIEPQRKTLNSINRSLSDLLFQMFQFFVRHNHTSDDKYKSLSDEEIEGWYDEIYQMYLLAKLELDHVDRAKRVREFLAIPNNGAN